MGQCLCAHWFAALFADLVPGWKKLQGGRDGGAGGGKDGGHFGLRKGNKALHDSGIKLRATGFDEPPDGLLVRKTNAVRARGNHGVKGIDHGDDARNDGNLRALKASRIAFSVDVFVVVENIERGAFESGEHAQNRPAVFGMLFHKGVFIRVEAPRLSQDGVWNSHFADIVEKGGNFQILEFRFFQAEFLADAHAPFREARAMHAGVEILQIQKLVEGTDHRATQRGDLLFDLFDADGVWRPGYTGGYAKKRWVLGEHGSYKQSNRHEPEVEVELELFTQAETAW